MIRRALVPTDQIAYLSFILDSYEDVAILTTLEKRPDGSRVEFRIADDFAEVFDRILADLAREGVPVVFESCGRRMPGAPRDLQNADGEEGTA